APIQYSHDILRSLSAYWQANPQCGLGPDAKSQVTLRYENNVPVGVDSLVVSLQHGEDMHHDDIKAIVHQHVRSSLPDGWAVPEDSFYVNPTGRFVIGGPDGDAGLTGRKIIVDTYGGAAPHGGGAFSGKDPTKVDRSAAYAARYLAKNVVAAKLARHCTIQLSYAIGVAKPLSVYVELDRQAEIDPNRLSRILQNHLDLSPRGIRNHLDLHRPIYAPTAAYGHFGRKAEHGLFPWEQTDLVDLLKAEF
ncbi:MAG: methionine adenosyltransferase domain-containing protein, partial [Pseudomonadota bacterium]